MDDYDPNSMLVAKARQVIKQFLRLVNETEGVPSRESLGRVLAADRLSPANVPNYDNSAMDGYAFNSADICNSTESQIIGSAFAGKAFVGGIQSG